MTLQEKIDILPRHAVEEVNDFIDFLIEKYHGEDKLWQMRLSEKSLNKIWDNPQDDAYNELLER
jgi:hypothetical protein